MFFRKTAINIKNMDTSGNLLTDVNALFNFLGVSTDGLNVHGKRALKEAVTYTCIKILAETLSKLPLKIYQDQGDNGIKKASDHYLSPLFKLRPNKFMSAFTFWNCLEVQRNIHGNSYAWLDFITVGKNAGQIAAIYPLDSSRIQIWVDDVGLISSKNSIWYVYTDLKGGQYKIQSDEILHFKGLTLDGIVGISPVNALKNSIENAKSSEKFLNNSYKNGMQSAGIVNYVGDLSPKAEENFKNNFEQMSSGLKNANRISLLPIGYQYQPIALKLTDAQFLENTKLTAQQISAAFGIKLHQINELVKASFASTSEANREFYTDTMMATLTMYEQEITYKGFTDTDIRKGYYAKFNADVMLRGDTKNRYDAYATAIQNGVKTPNECRAMEEDAPKSGGDRLYMNGNYIPAEMAGQQYTKGGDS